MSVPKNSLVHKKQAAYQNSDTLPVFFTRLLLLQLFQQKLFAEKTLQIQQLE